MNLRWLKITLRVAAAFLLVAAAVIFALGGVSFRSEEQTSSDTYVIRHTVILKHSSIIMAGGSALLFGSSFLIARKRI
jgi:hypothetical protein